MPTTKECRHNAELCLMLANETTQIYAQKALMELATEFRLMAEDLDTVLAASSRGGRG